jgi:two-component system, LuxR family, sensor histidine kinase DctS
MPSVFSFVRRQWIWLVLSLSLVALLATLLMLVRSYLDTRGLHQLERDAAAIVADIRQGLGRNGQDLQTIAADSSLVPRPLKQAADLLAQRRELLQIEWRDADLRREAVQVSRHHSSHLSVSSERHLALFEMERACADARRFSAPSYSSSYFMPGPAGEGKELLDLCLPYKGRDGRIAYLIATYQLHGLLTEFVDGQARRGSALALTETDGTRLTSLGQVDWRVRPIAASQMMDLPGVVFMLRLERSADHYGTLPWAVAAGTALLGLLTLALLSLLAVDIRRRQRAEARLAEALAFRQAMEDSLITGLRARDMAGRITYVNPAFCRIVGMEASQLLGTSNPAPYWPPERVTQYSRLTPPVPGAALERQGLETEFMRPDGTRVPVLIVEAPLRNAEGTQTGWMSAVLDQSEKRQVEEVTRATQERLQATARLAMVGEMASLISHELNQPLSAISSYANGSLNLLQQDGPLEPLRPDLVEAMARISQQSARAGKVIRSIADLVRRRERSRARTRVQSLFDGIDPLVSLQARKLGVVAETRVEPNCPDVFCDATMVEQVLLNLARNGLQAMAPGGSDAASGPRRLTLAAGLARPASERPGRWVEFTVTDQGQGLSEEVKRQLFTPFYTTKPEGMGLGLSLCRTVIEQHGGELGHRPNVPSGTVFHFTLPMAAD